MLFTTWPNISGHPPNDNIAAHSIGRLGRNIEQLGHPSLGLAFRSCPTFIGGKKSYFHLIYKETSWTASSQGLFIKDKVKPAWVPLHSETILGMALEFHLEL